MAEKLGLAEAAELLGETLAEEEEADTKLTEVAEGLYAEVTKRPMKSKRKRTAGAKRRRKRGRPASANPGGHRGRFCRGSRTRPHDTATTRRASALTLMAKAVIFDIDGTLIDPVDMHARAWQETFFALWR